MGGRPPGGAGAGGTRCAPANAEAPVTADDGGANGTDLSPERAMPGTGPGTVTGPAAGSGAAAGFGGGAGTTTALRAAALISAMERVSG